MKRNDFIKSVSIGSLLAEVFNPFRFTSAEPVKAVKEIEPYLIIEKVEPYTPNSRKPNLLTHKCYYVTKHGRKIEVSLDAKGELSGVTDYEIWYVGNEYHPITYHSVTGMSADMGTFVLNQIDVYYKELEATLLPNDEVKYLYCTLHVNNPRLEMSNKIDVKENLHYTYKWYNVLPHQPVPIPSHLC